MEGILVVLIQGVGSMEPVSYEVQTDRGVGLWECVRRLLGLKPRRVRNRNESKVMSCEWCHREMWDHDNNKPVYFKTSEEEIKTYYEFPAPGGTWEIKRLCINCVEQARTEGRMEE